MSRDEVCRRRFGPGFAAPCVHPETVECALWECQSRNRCKDSLSGMAEKLAGQQTASTTRKSKAVK